jgi:pantoate kinase
MDQSGSRGAGLCLSFGAVSQVSVKPVSQQAILVYINGKISSAPVTKLALTSLMGSKPMGVTVNTTLDLPLSQGFGMSAAGALSATLAFSGLFDIPREHAIQAAHYAEVHSRTGLGDVVASSFGGIEIRRKAGLPPWGVLEHIPGDYEVVLCVVGKKLETKKILTDTAKIHKIASYGRYCTKKLLENPSLEHLFALAWEFTQQSHLADRLVLQAIKEAHAYGMASMCMLGNSVFAIGDTPQLCQCLSRFGKVFCCSVDIAGARVIQSR